MKTIAMFLMIVYCIVLFNTACAIDNTIVAGCANGKVAIYHATESSEPNTTWNIGSEVVSVDISQDGAYIIIGGKQKLVLCNRNGQVQWEKQINVLSGWSGWAGQESNTVGISDDGQYFAACCDGGLYVYKNGTEVTQHWSNSGNETCVSISPDGQYVAACNNEVHLFLIDSSTPLWTKSSMDARWVAVSDSGHVAVVNRNALYLYNQAGSKIWSYHNNCWNGDHMRVDISKNGRYVIAGNDDSSDSDGSVLCCFSDETDSQPGWSTADGTPKWTHSGTGSRSDIYSLSISENSNIIVAGGSPDIDTHLFLNESNSPISSFAFGSPQSFDLTFLGDYGAAGDQNGNVYYFSMDTSNWQDSLESRVKSVAIASISLRLLTPNGGEKLVAGTSYTIQWLHENAVESINIEYSADGGEWVSIATDVPAENKEFNWEVPSNLVSDQCLIKISDAQNPGVNDTSDDVFRIVWLLLIQPNGGEELLAKDSYEIQWKIGSGKNINIDFSADNGDTWKRINQNPESGNSYDWTVSYVTSEQCLIKISDANQPDYPDYIDVSDETFTVRIIDLIYPDGGERFQVGDPNAQIRWRWNCEPQDILQIELSRDSSQSWQPLQAVPGSQKSTLWIVSQPCSDQCLIRVSDPNDPNAVDVSKNVFTIHYIQVIAPNGGEKLIAGTIYPIEWLTDSNYVQYVMLEYSTECDGDWIVIDPNVPSTPPTYLWTLPAVSSDQCRVRVSDKNNPTVNYDISDGMFTIRQLQDYPPDPNEYQPDPNSIDPNDYYWLYPDPNDIGIPGDIVDGNYVDLDDFAAFSAAWPDGLPIGDLNGDGLVDLSDLFVLCGHWLYCNDPSNDLCGRLYWPESWNWPYQCLGDANHSNLVNTADENILNEAIGSDFYGESYHPAADFNRDGRIDQRDQTILNYWRNISPLPGPCKTGGWWPPDL